MGDRAGWALGGRRGAHGARGAQGGRGGLAAAGAQGQQREQQRGQGEQEQRGRLAAELHGAARRLQPPGDGGVPGRIAAAGRAQQMRRGPFRPLARPPARPDWSGWPAGGQQRRRRRRRRKSREAWGGWVEEGGRWEEAPAGLSGEKPPAPTVLCGVAARRPLGNLTSNNITPAPFTFI